MAVDDLEALNRGAKELAAEIEDVLCDQADSDGTH